MNNELTESLLLNSYAPAIVLKKHTGCKGIFLLTETLPVFLRVAFLCNVEIVNGFKGTPYSSSLKHNRFLNTSQY